MNLSILFLKRFKPHHILVFSFAIFAMACHDLRKTSNVQLKSFQGIVGKVLIKRGNFNPDGSIADEGKVYAEKRMVYVYELTDLASTMYNGHFVTSIFTSLIATAETDELGRFKLELPEGIYSVFVENNGQWHGEVKPYENDFYFNPIEIYANKAYIVDLEVR